MGREEALGLLNELAPEALRVAAAGFAAESGMVKIEILNTSLRLITAPSTRSESTLALHSYILELCEADVAFDVRDRARFVKQLSAALAGEAGSASDSARQAATQVVLRPQFQAQTSQGKLTASARCITTAWTSQSSRRGRPWRSTWRAWARAFPG